MTENPEVELGDYLSRTKAKRTLLIQIADDFMTRNKNGDTLINYYSVTSRRRKLPNEIGKVNKSIGINRRHDEKLPAGNHKSSLSYRDDLNVSVVNTTNDSSFLFKSKNERVRRTYLSSVTKHTTKMLVISPSRAGRYCKIPLPILKDKRLKSMNNSSLNISRFQIAERSANAKIDNLYDNSRVNITTTYL